MTDRAAPLALLALVLALFRDVLFRGRVFFERDIPVVVLAQSEDFWRCIHAGSWPLWNPYSGFGQPLLANPGAQALYPWTWLNLLMAPTTFFTAYVMGHAFLTGLGLYAFLRRLSLSSPAALTGAAVWMTSGPLLSLPSLWQHFAGAAWIPWALLVADRALAEPGLRRSLVWGAVMAGQVLAGSVEMSVATVLLVAAYSLRYLQLGRPLHPQNLRVLGWGFAGGLTALALSAGQWLPALELLEETGRAALPLWVRTFWSLHPFNLVQLVLPVSPRDLPLAPGLRHLLFEAREPFLNSIYLGLATVPLAVASLLGARRRLASFFAGTAVLATLVALGRHSFAYYAAISLLPILLVFRYPAKAMVVVAFAGAVMSGLGFEAWRRGGHGVKLALIPAVVATAAVALLAMRADWWAPLALSGDHAEVSAGVVRDLVLASSGAAIVIVLLLASGRRPALIGVAGAVAVVGLVLAHDDQNPTAPRELFETPPAAVKVLREQGASRVFAFDYRLRQTGRQFRGQFVEAYTPSASAWPLPLRQALARLDYLGFPTGDRWGFFGSFEYDALSLHSRRLVNLSLVFRASEETPGFLRLLRIAAVSHVLSLHAEGLEDLVPVASFPGRAAAMVHVFRVPDPRPRVYPAGTARIADGLAALKTLVDPAFDPSREVVLASGSPSDAGAGFAAETRLLAYRPDRIDIEARFQQPGYVVVVDAYDPGWRATVGGRPSPVLRANAAFRAVAVPAGSHRLTLVYRPRGALIGLWISAAAAALCLLAGLRSAARAGSGPR